MKAVVLMVGCSLMLLTSHECLAEDANEKPRNPTGFEVSFSVDEAAVKSGFDRVTWPKLSMTWGEPENGRAEIASQNIHPDPRARHGGIYGDGKVKRQDISVEGFSGSRLVEVEPGEYACFCSFSFTAWGMLNQSKSVVGSSQISVFTVRPGSVSKVKVNISMSNKEPQLTIDVQ